MKLASISLPLSVITAIAAAEVFQPYKGSVASDSIFEQFADEEWSDRWKVSHAKRDGEFSYVGKWNVEESSVYPAFDGDKGLVVKSPAAHHAISYVFDKPFDNKDNDLVLQYEVKFQEGLNCGGAYIKLLSQTDQLAKEEFNNDTPYQVMFGPDKCGSTNKVHFIIKRKDPQTGEYEEKHLRIPPMARITKHTSLYTLIIKQNNDFEVRINGETAKAGNLLDETLFEPSFNPPKEIDDPKDTKPEDWVEEEEIPDPDEAEKPADWDEEAPRKIPDPEATKPDDWDEDTPEYIPDPEASKPGDWDDEEDGEWIAPEVPNPECQDHGCGKWEAPLIPNPNYKGKWIQPLIPNPDYKGEWAPRKIANPDYFEDSNASDLEPIGGFGFELWTMDKDILFDNIYLGHSIDEAETIGNATFVKKVDVEKSKLEEDHKKKLEDEPAKPIADEEEEQDFVLAVQGKIDELAAFARKFLSNANQYLLDLGENPAKVLEERPIEGAIYAGVFGLIFTVFFGLFAVVLLKLTSEMDDSVDAKSGPATLKKQDEVKPEAKIQEIVDDDDELVEKIQESADATQTTSSKKSETIATKRG